MKAKVKVEKKEKAPVKVKVDNPVAPEAPVAPVKLADEAEALLKDFENHELQPEVAQPAEAQPAAAQPAAAAPAAAEAGTPFSRIDPITQQE